MDNLALLGVGLQRVQERFDAEGVPFSTIATITSDGGVLIEAKFLLADVSFPVAWDHGTEFENVNKLVKGMYSFVNDPRPTGEILAERTELLRQHLEELRELDPELDEFDAEMRQAREEFQEFVEGIAGGAASDYAQ